MRRIPSFTFLVFAELMHKHIYRRKGDYFFHLYLFINLLHKNY